MITEAPKRLISDEGELGELLRDAQRGYLHGLDAQRALLRARGARQRVPTLAGWALALGLAATAIGAALWFGGLRSAAPLQVTAETPPVRARPVPALPTASSSSRAPAVALGDRHRAAPAAAPREREPRRAEGAPASSSASSSVSPAQDPTEREQCLTFARQGEPRRAADCFKERAGGGGLSAQVALYELSRLQRDALGEPAAALDSLTQYLQRFPSGSLNGEVRFSRLELLARLGKTSEALSASREFLSSPFGAERAAEVHLFRGNLFLRGAGSAADAAREYREAQTAPGRVGDDAAYQLAVALEAGGAREQAIEAYQRYLARNGGRHRSSASARLAELSTHP